MSRFQRLRCRTSESSTPHRILALLLFIFVAKGVIFTFTFPPFSGHDEVMHYAYLRVLVDDGRIPVIPDLEAWRSERTQSDVVQPAFDHAPEELFKYAHKGRLPKMSFTTADWFGDYDTPVWSIVLQQDYYPSGWIYTANHPPLYYILMTPLMWAASSASITTQLYLLRLAAISFGLITVLFSFKLTRAVFPADHFLAILVPTIIAFQPQLAYEAAMLNNDIVAIALTSIVLYLLARGIRERFPWRCCVLTGFVLGLSLLAKNTSAVSAVIIAVAMVLGLGPRNWRQWMPRGAVTAAVAGLLVWPWYLYMIMTYGDLTALNRIKALQYWNYGGGQGRSIWDQLTDPDFAWMRWNETWGEFGWRLIRLDTSLVWLLFYVCLMGLIGVVWWGLQNVLVTRGQVVSFRNAAGRPKLPGIVPLGDPRAPATVDPIYQSGQPAVITVVTLALACVIAYYAVLQFGTSFSLTQARYYFPSLPAFAVLVMLGYRVLIPRQWHAFAEAAFLIGWFMLNMVIFSIYVIPYWQLSA